MLEEANLGGTVEGFVVIIEADFSNRDEFRARFRGTNESGEGLRVDDRRLGVRVGIFGVDAVSTEDVFMGGGEGLGIRGVLGVCADDDDLVDAGSMSILKELLGLVGREPLLVVEVTMRIDKIGGHRDIIALFPAMREEVRDDNEESSEGKDDEEMKDGRLEGVKGESFEGRDEVVGRDIPVGREDMGGGDNAVGEPGDRDEGAAEEAAAEGDDVRDAIDGVATAQEVRDKKGEGGGAERENEGVQNKPEAVKREHNGPDDDKANEDIG